MRILRAAFVGLAITLTAAPALAAFDTYLKIDGIEGESKDANHSHWLEAQNVTIGSQSTGAGAGKVTFNDFKITKTTDKASPMLFNATQGPRRVIPNITIEFANDNEHAVTWRAVLHDAQVTSYRVLPHGPGQPETEEVVITPKTSEIWTRPALANGAFGEWVKRSFDDARRQRPALFASTPVAHQ